MLVQQSTSGADAINGEGQGGCRRTLPGRRVRIVRSRRSAAGCRTRQRLLGERSNDLCDDHHHHDGDRDDDDRPRASLLGALSRNRIRSPSVGEDQGPTESRVDPSKTRRRAAQRPRGLPFRGPDGRVKGPRPRPLGGRGTHSAAQARSNLGTRTSRNTRVRTGNRDLAPRETRPCRPRVSRAASAVAGYGTGLIAPEATSFRPVLADGSKTSTWSLTPGKARWMLFG